MRVENNLAILDIYNSNYSGSLKRLSIVINYFSKTDSEIDLIQAKISRGLLFYKMGKLKDSINALLNAIPDSWKNSESEFRQAWCNYVIGNIELAQNNVDLFRENLLKSMSYWEKTETTK